MRTARTAVTIAVLAAAIAGGASLAATSGGSGSGPVSAYGTGSRTAASTPAPSTTAHGSAPRPARAVVHAVTATVGGRRERILADPSGLPLYLHRPDGATESRVTGQLAVLWPPLLSASPAVAGARGPVTSVHTAHGAQVAYAGHLLYTFVEDTPGQVTGQGVANFFVATPGLGSSAASSATS
jgi:predicted lipoprotein with Yx(FWY)xxD motif